MSSPVSSILSYATSELTAHGLMLFAGLTAGFTFLRMVYDYKFNELSAKREWLMKGYFVAIQGALLGFPTYLLLRLRYYGSLLNQINLYDYSTSTLNYTQLMDHLYTTAVKELEAPTRWFTYLDWIPRIGVSWGIGIVFAIILLVPVILDKRLKNSEDKPKPQFKKSK